jgi:beta-N-acetylhexosaminidase
MIRGFKDSGIIPILKHIPGHGRATIDSHKGLPEVNAELRELLLDDFITFRELKNAPMAMTAHIKYSKIDNVPATFSKKIIQVIKEKIQFSGVIISDDINMAALEGSIEKKIMDSLSAGCDIVLHCSGENLAILNIIKKIPKIDKDIIDKSLDKFKLSQKDEDSITIDDVINKYYSILDEYKIIL